jgi:hypothetical protein
MNKIEFKNHNIVRPNGWKLTRVEIKIDQVDLIKIARRYEKKFDECKKNKKLAGAYGYITKPDNPLKYFLGQDIDDNYYEDKTRVLECDCGNYGCWPLICRIKEENDTVTWSDFENVHRSERVPENGIWVYNTDFKFEFNKYEYIESIKKTFSEI